MSKPTGRVIVFDGPDGVGKSTQLNLLASYLRSSGYKVHATRASGGTPMGLKLRRASLSNVPRHAETDLYISLAMHTDLGYDIQKRKAAGEIVLVDRSPLAIIAYQVYASKLPNINEGYSACKKMLRHWQVDNLIVFDAMEQVLKDRRQKREIEDKTAANNYFEHQDDNYHQLTQEGYRAATKFVQATDSLSGIHVIEIDAAPDIKSIATDIRLKLGL